MGRVSRCSGRHKRDCYQLVSGRRVILNQKPLSENSLVSVNGRDWVQPDIFGDLYASLQRSGLFLVRQLFAQMIMNQLRAERPRAVGVREARFDGAHPRAPAET